MEDNKKSFRKGLLTGALSALAVMLLFVFGAGVYLKVAVGNSGVLNGITRTKIEYLISMMDAYYYDDVDRDALETGLYKGLIAALGDPYSTYYTAREYEDMLIDATGNYAGIGALLRQDPSTYQVFVNEVYEGSPAEAAGIRAEDEILSVDGQEVDGRALEEYVQLIRGEEGTQIAVRLLRDGERELTVTVTRAQVEVPSVSCRMLDGNVGYIKISEFSQNTREQFDNAMAELESQGMTSVIFDLRNNGGGLLDSVTEILDEILPEGITVYMEDKQGKRTDYPSDAEHYLSYPMVVLVSSYTASAAEIFAGAIRDFDYGTLIGTKTFGKGIVQTTMQLRDGSAVKLTTATYYTPSGECIHKKGIEPDVTLEYAFLGDEGAEYDEMLDNQVLKALEILRAAP